MKWKREDGRIIFMLSYMAAIVWLGVFVGLPQFTTDEPYLCDPLGGNYCRSFVASVWGLPPELWAIAMGILTACVLWTMLTWGRSGST